MCLAGNRYKSLLSSFGSAGTMSISNFSSNDESGQILRTISGLMMLFFFERKKLIATIGVWVLLIDHSLMTTARSAR